MTRPWPWLPLILAAVVGGGVMAPRAARGQGWTVRRSGFDKQVVARYKRILANNPWDRGALAKLSALYRKHRSIAKLASEYRAQIDRSPSNWAALVVLATLLDRAGKSEQSLALLEQASKHKNHPKLHLEVGDALRRAGRFGEAARVYEHALPSGNKRTVLKRLAETHLDAGNIDEASRRFEQYIAAYPQDSRVRASYGDALLSFKRYRVATRVFSELESRQKSDPRERASTLAKLGSAYSGAGDPDKALATYNRGLRVGGRFNYIRIEITERIINIHRQRQTLMGLIKSFERRWPVRKRRHFEWDVLARLYEEVGNTDAALKALHAAVKRSPHELDTQRRLIRLLEQSGRDKEALARYEKVARLAPGEPRFQLELARRYMRAGQSKKALKIIRRAERRFGHNPGVLSTIGDLFTGWGLDKQALRIYVRLTRIEPDEPYHWEILGERYFQLGNKPKAMAAWAHIIKTKSATHYARLGRIYMEHALLRESQRVLTQAILLEPKNHKHYRDNAILFEKTKRWSKAASFWQKSYERIEAKASNAPLLDTARRRMIGALTMDRSLSRSVSKWERAFSRGVPEPSLGYLLVEAYLRTGQYPDARRVLTMLLTNNPGDVATLERLAQVHTQTGDYDQAIVVFERLMKLDPNMETELLHRIAEIKTRQNRDGEAIEYARRALARDPKDSVAHERLADRYLEIQQYENAIAALEKTIALDPNNFQAHFKLARAYRNASQLTAAAKLYRRVLGRATDDAVIERAGRLGINLEELTETLGELERVLVPLAFAYQHRSIYRRLVVDLYGRYVPALTHQRDHHHDPRQRAAAAQELHRLGRSGLKPLLVALADERDRDQRRIAVRVLGNLDNQSAAPALIALAKTEPPAVRAGTGRVSAFDWNIRVAALKGAGQLGADSVIPDLVSLSKREEKSLREAAVYALGMSDSDRASRALVHATRDDQASVRMLACLGLARQPRAYTSRLIELARDPAEPDEVRAACIYALGVRRESGATGALQEVLGVGNDHAQRLSAWALGRIRARAAVPVLFRAYFNKRGGVRASAAWALSEILGTPSDNAPTPSPRVYDKDTFTPKLAASRLAAVNDTRPLSARTIAAHHEAITKALDQALSGHSDLVTRALGDMDGSPLTVSLGALYRPRKSTDRATTEISRALGPTLARILTRSRPEIAARALSVLAKSGWPGAHAVLTSSLKAQDPRQLAAAMRNIAPYIRAGKPRHESLASTVAGQLSTARDFHVQAAAAEALGNYGYGAWTRSLVDALTSPKIYPLAREYAARALGQLRDARATQALLDSVPKLPDRLAMVALTAAVEADPRVTPALRALAKGARSPKVRARAGELARSLEPKR